MEYFLLKNSAIIICAALLVFFGLFFAAPEVQAACSPPASGDYTISASCSFTAGVDGVDAGTGSTNIATLTVAAGQTLTVGTVANQTIARGVLIREAGAAIILNKGVGAQIIKAPLWVQTTDADGDGFVILAGTYVAQSDQPGADYIRRNTSAGTASDCNDANINIFTNRTVATDADQDGYGTSSASSQCSGASTTVSGRTYYKNSAGNYYFIASGSMLGTSDCNDSDSAKWQNLTGYTDSDGDGYGVGGSSQVCSGASLPSGYANNANDCYDSNVNARPGQTDWFTTHRGDGSFDYNCNGAEEVQYDQVCDVFSGGWVLPFPGCGATGGWDINGGGHDPDVSGPECSADVQRTQGCH